jgi:hypothetical protein
MLASEHPSHTWIGVVYRLREWYDEDNLSRGVWALTAKGRNVDRVHPRAVRRFVQEQNRKARASAQNAAAGDADAEQGWRDELMREAGFIQVEVTGRSGDGGIDGKGIVRLGGLLGFHVIFQCKRSWGWAYRPGRSRSNRSPSTKRGSPGCE